MSHRNSTTAAAVAPTSVEAAAMEAAMADGLISANGLYTTDEKAKKAGLRRGKWTSEEEAYANRLIYEFKQGLLPLTEGTTLRTFLSKLLNCDPMRISKKFVGANCIGKQVFRRRQQELEKLSSDQIDVQRRELGELERKFLERVASANRSKTAALQPAAPSAGAKDDRASYDGDAGGGGNIPAPWAAAPHSQQAVPLSDLSSMAADQLMGMGGSNSNSNAAQYFLKQRQPPFGQNSASFASHTPQLHRQQQAALGLAPYPYSEGIPSVSTRSNSNLYRSASGPDGSNSFSRATSLEMLNSIAQMGSSTGSLENMGNMGDASALKQQQLMYQSQQQMRMLHAFGGGGAGSSSSGADQGDPTANVFPGLIRGTSDNVGGSTLTFADSMGGWPSFGNLNSLSGGIGGGGSMDDLLSAGLLSRQVSGGSPFDLDGPSGSSGGSDKYAGNKFLGLPAEEGVSLGYSLEDSNPPASSVAATIAGAAAGGRGAADSSLSSSYAQAQTQQVRVKAPIVDMAVMRQQQQQQQQQLQSAGSATSSASSRVAEGKIDNNSNGVEQERLFDGSSNLEPSRLNGSLPKNGSVEDFWMLVNMGDLPQPEQDVLSQMVWSPLERASAASAAAAATAAQTQAQTVAAACGGGGSVSGVVVSSEGENVHGSNDHDHNDGGPLTMSPHRPQHSHMHHHQHHQQQHSGHEQLPPNTNAHGHNIGKRGNEEKEGIKAGEEEREHKRSKLETDM